MEAIIAFPSENPGGLEANLSGHFGHCSVFTLVTLTEAGVAKVETVPNVPHEHGGLHGAGPSAGRPRGEILVAYGMGARPLQGFNQVGIMVLLAGEAKRVSDALEALSEGRLSRFEPAMACGGGHH